MSAHILAHLAPYVPSWSCCKETEARRRSAAGGSAPAIRAAAGSRQPIQRDWGE